jgi:hypothetical protein
MKVPWVKSVGDKQKGMIRVTLTSEGQKASEDFSQEGGSFNVLAALSQKRPQSISDLAKASNMSFSDCLKICQDLKADGYVTQVQRGQ